MTLVKQFFWNNTMMVWITVLFTFGLLLNCAKPGKPQFEEAPGSYIEVLDDEALKFVDSKTKVEILADGFNWTEGPLWVETGKYLLFSDIPENRIYKLDSNGVVSLYLKPSGYTGKKAREKELGSNGLALDANGSLILMQQGDRRVARMISPLNNPQPTFETLADRYIGKKLNSPNDGAYDGQGNLYFTDPPYGLAKGMGDPEKELGFQGVYCLMNTGNLILLDSLSRPNGIALSADESQLYVAVSDPDHAVWYVYSIENAGIVKNKALFYDVTHFSRTENNQGLPDGMKTNINNYLFATGPGGVWVFNPSGKPIARIHTGQKTSNCAFSKDEKTLFMTADDYILKVALN